MNQPVFNYDEISDTLTILQYFGCINLYTIVVRECTHCHNPRFCFVSTGVIYC